MARTTTNVSTMPFVVDLKSLTNEQGGQIDWDNVRRSDYITGTVTTSAEAVATATSIAVVALPVALPSGTILTFGAGEFAKLTAAAALGATSLTVEALPATIESGDTATYTVTGTGTKSVDAGTVMCRLSSGKICPRASRPGSETAIGLLGSGAAENNMSAALTGYGVIVGGVIWENLLPDYANASWATFKSEMQTAGVGTGFGFRTYSNSLD